MSLIGRRTLSPSAWTLGLMERLDERRRRNRIYRATLAELNQLSDRDLVDLGLSRANFQELARQAAERA